MHSLLLVLAGAASLHVRQELAAADAAVKAVQAGVPPALAAARAAAGARGKSLLATAASASASAATSKTPASAPPAGRGRRAGRSSSGRSLPTTGPAAQRQGRRPGNSSTVLTRGDFSGGSTLLSRHHRLAARAEVTASARSSMAVMALLPRATIIRWCKTVPGGQARLAQWFEKGAAAMGSDRSGPAFDTMAAAAAATTAAEARTVSEAQAARAAERQAAKAKGADSGESLDEWFFGGM